MVWLTDTKGGRSACRADRIAYVEVDEDGSAQARRLRALADHDAT